MYKGKLGRLDRLFIRVHGSMFSHKERGIDYHIFYCKEHGYVMDYPRGHNLELRCPDCEKAKLKCLNV